MSIRVILIDDSDLMRAALRNTLDTFGGVTNVDEYPSATAYLGAGAPYCENTVIFTDYKMPNLTGVGLVARLRKRALRFIIFTSSVQKAQEEARREGLKLTIIEKGCDSRDIVQAIRKARENPAIVVA